jgi:hypothetical protein
MAAGTEVIAARAVACSPPWQFGDIVLTGHYRRSDKRITASPCGLSQGTL